MFSSYIVKDMFLINLRKSFTRRSYLLWSYEQLNIVTEQWLEHKITYIFV